MSEKYEVKREKYPGEITNKSLIYTLKEFINDGDEKNEDNIVIKHDIDQKKNIKFINEEIWKFFKDKYGGGPDICRKVLEEKANSSKKFVELYLLKYNVCFLPRKEDLNENNIDRISIKPIFISRIKKIKDIKNALIKANKYNNKKIDIGHIRLWKVSPNNTLDEIKKMLNSYQKEKEKNKKIETEIITYLECKNIYFKII